MINLLFDDGSFVILMLQIVENYDFFFHFSFGFVGFFIFIFIYLFIFLQKWSMLSDIRRNWGGVKLYG